MSPSRNIRRIKLTAIGATLLWLLLPAQILDIFLAPQWFAPHWKCDSLGIPLLQATRLAVPWACVSLATAATLVAVTTWNRPLVPGLWVFGKATPRTYVATTLAALLVALLLWDVLTYTHQVFFPQTLVADCNGRAEPITVTLRRPFLQTMPLVELALALWVLRLRAIAVSRPEPRIEEVF